MALQPVYETQDAIPEALRGEYKEQDGKWVLDVDVEAHPAVAGLKTALQSERNAVKKAKADLAEAKKHGTAAEVAEKMARLAELEEQVAKGGGGGDDLAKLRQDMKADMQKALDAQKATYEQQLAEERGKRRQSVLHDQLKSMAIAAGVLPELADDTVRLLASRFDLDEKDAVFLKDKDGDPSTVTPEKFWAEVYKKERPQYYKGTQTSGGGGRGGPSGADQTGVITLTAEQASDYSTMQDALKQVKGDYSKIKIEQPAGA